MLWLRVGMLGLCLTTVAFSDSAEALVAETAVDADLISTVGEILQTSCLDCHRGDDPQGQLNLETREAVEIGGHTGLPLLNGGKDSEFLRRLISEDAGYRMPKDAPKLNPEQIATLTRWVENGAPWPSLPRHELVVVQKDPPKPQSWVQWGNDLLDRMLRLQEQVRILAIPALIFFIGVLAIERTRKQLDAPGNRNAAITPTRWQKLVHVTTNSHYVIGVMALLMAAMTSVFLSEYRELENHALSLVPSANISSLENPRDVSDIEKQAQSRRPKHPPQLSGTYFRGNDERNEQLFNGGFYCTTVMRVALLDDDQKTLTWGDYVGSRPRLSLEIEKAPFATPELFTEKAMTSYRLSREITKEGVRARENAYLSASVPEKVWRAELPLGELSNNATGDFNATFELQAGGVTHYAICCKLALTDGVLQPTSEIWMSAIMLTANVRAPLENEVSLSEWFDFRPIPMIEGGNSRDSKLLGIDEHFQSLDSLQTNDNANEIDSDPD